jgi:NADH-quinone oxidoreductase subunit N
MSTSELTRYCLGILPELILALTICAVILFDMFTPLRRSRVVCGAVALLGVAWALAALLLDPNGAHLVARFFPEMKAAAAGPSFHNMLVRDGLASFFRLVFLLGGAATIFFSMRSRETEGYRQGEYYGLLLGSLLGACLLASSGHYVMFILALETLSMCSYVLAGFIKHERISAEASLKYLLYGAVASGVMMFGISYLYGLTGTLDIAGVMRSVVDSVKVTGGAPVLPAGFAVKAAALLLALVLVLAGLGFKVAMVPFHFWCPDVYQGAPTPITAFLSVVSKAAGFSAILRVFLPFFVSPLGQFVANAVNIPLLFGVLAVLTMSWGNLVALRQTDIKRLLAYSSIAHAGYLLMMMTVYSKDAVQALLFYFFMYLIMNLGIFWCVIILINRLGGPEISRFRGARLKAPFLFWMVFIFLISLTGVPPTAGFVGKLMLFKVVISEGLQRMSAGAMSPAAWGYFAMAVIGVVNSVVSAFYYLRIARVMAFDAPVDERPIPMDLFDYAAVLVFAVPVLALLYFTPVLELTKVF